MDKTTIILGIGIIFFALVAIICRIKIIKIDYKIKELELMQLLINQTEFALNTADLMININEKIMHYKCNSSDLFPLNDAIKLNFKAIDSIQSNVRDLHKFIDSYQKEKKK